MGDKLSDERQRNMGKRDRLKTIFGYGEDALTLWAVTERLELILDELGDDSDPTACARRIKLILLYDYVTL